MCKAALQKAIVAAGGQSALARACGVKQGHVWYWLRKAKAIPAEKAIAIEKATNGRVRRDELRPDIFNKNSWSYSNDNK